MPRQKTKQLLVRVSEEELSSLNESYKEELRRLQKSAYLLGRSEYIRQLLQEAIAARNEKMKKT